MREGILLRTPLTAAAVEVASRAAGCAGEAEAARRLDEGVVAATLDAGFARHFVPTRHGGNAGTFVDLLEAVATIGEACPSSAWFASLTASLGRMAAFLPEPAQQELWAAGPDPLIVGALMPLGRATPVDGGWRLSGRWPYVSGVDASDWALVCAMATPDGRSGSDIDAEPEARFMAVRRRDFTIEDTWFNVGMRATGSNTITVDGVFVPTDRSFTRAALVAGHLDAPDACHAAPLKAVNGLSFAAPVLGAARGALTVWSGYIGGKLGSGPTRRTVPGATSAGYDLALARASGEIDASQLLLERAAAVADGGGVDARLTARATRDSALAADTLVTAVDRLFRAGGTTAQSSSSVLQRFWRDVHAAASHVVLDVESAARAYGAVALNP